MATREEEDYPAGHPARFDYNPDSPEAKEWMRKHANPLGERDFPVDHPKAVDTPGNTNQLAYAPGVDPHNPELEEHTGRTPKVAKRMRDINLKLAEKAKESGERTPTEAPDPPPAPNDVEPAGQPSEPSPRARRESNTKKRR